MVNQEELAICKRRGHSVNLRLLTSEGGWNQCEWCGLWLREVRTVEEREDDPPEPERAQWQSLLRKQERTMRKLKEKPDEPTPPG